MEHICNSCLESIKQFDEFCDSVRNVHGFTQVYDESTKDDATDEPIEYVEEEIVENIEDLSIEFQTNSTLSIEKDFEKTSALARRPGRFDSLISVFFSCTSHINNKKLSLSLYLCL